MVDRSPFDARPDAELGALLREALGSQDDAALVARIVAQFDTRRTTGLPFVEVLAGWGRAGAVVAAVAATLALYLVLPHGINAGAVEALRTEPAAREALAPLLSATRPPDPNLVFATAFEP